MAPPPPKLDWRRATNGNFVTPIRDQQTCGSCVAFATCAVLESRILIASSSPGTDLDLSEAHLFFCGTTNACEVGWIYDKALKSAQKNGVGLEADFPYVPHNQACRNIPPVVKVAAFQTAASSIQRKRALQKGPVVAGLQVYADFMAYRSGVYQHVTGDFAGWHAVAVVGYDDAEQCWIAKNSWGTGWGEKGFFRIRYGECAIDSQVLFYDPDITILTVPTPGPKTTAKRAKTGPAGSNAKLAASGQRKPARKKRRDDSG
jgi:C1A family cysteine protease